MKRRVIDEGTRTYRRGNVHFQFLFQRSHRRTIGITIFPGGEIRVRAPLQTREAAVHALLAQREQWIEKRQTRLAVAPQLPAERFTPGYRIPLLGRYRLVTTTSAGPPARLVQRAVLRADAFLVTATNTPHQVQKALYPVYREVALRIFTQRLRILRQDPAVAALGEAGTLGVRLMRRRWGSCFPDGRIVLNTELCGAPVAQIDYVILHELCHLRERNHSPRFYRLMDQLMPDWKQRREQLNNAIPGGFLTV